MCSSTRDYACLLCCFAGVATTTPLLGCLNHYCSLRFTTTTTVIFVTIAILRCFFFLLFSVCGASCLSHDQVLIFQKKKKTAQLPSHRRIDTKTERGNTVLYTSNRQHGKAKKKEAIFLLLLFSPLLSAFGVPMPKRRKKKRRKGGLDTQDSAKTSCWKNNEKERSKQGLASASFYGTSACD